MNGVNIEDLQAGDVLVADGGFTCLKEGQHVHVERRDSGELFVRCSEGKHLLEGQLDFGGNKTLVGLTRPSAS